MKNIFNWTVGSFFRTFGRIIAYLIIGGLIAFILSDNDFKISELFFDKVSASTHTVPVKQVGAGYIRINDSTLTSVSYGYKYSLTRSNDSTINNKLFTFETGINATTFDYIEFNFLLSVPPSTELNNDSTITGRYCSKYECYQYCSSGSCTGMCEEYRCTSYSSYTAGTISNQEVYPVEFETTSMSVRISYTDGNWAFCDINGNTIMCPTNRSPSIAGIDLYYNFRSDHITTASFILYRGPRYYQLIDSTSAIESQTQQQQQQHQEMMDSNTTQAESDASDFFGNFTVEDTGGLSAIITAPLNTIQSLLSSTCTNLVLPLPFVNQNLTLPCMNDIYTTHFGAFFTLYQTIILAIISYRCIRSIFFDIKGFSDPDDDRIEVMDL